MKIELLLLNGYTGKIGPVRTRCPRWEWTTYPLGLGGSPEWHNPLNLDTMTDYR